MEVTQEMLNAAMKKAVENGLVPKYADGIDCLKYWRIIREVIEAAIEAG